MQTKNISFKNQQGLSLAAKLDLPDEQQAHTFAIFAHCFTCHKDLTAVVNIARALTSQGIAVLRFDFTGLGKSEGDFSSTSLTTNINDVSAAAEYLTTHYQAPRLMIGHSFGGVAAIYAANAIDSIEAVTTIASPATTEHVQHLFKEQQQEIHEKGEAVITIGGRDITLGKVFVDDIINKDLPALLQTLRKPLLVFHSPQDSVVTVDNAQLIYQSAKHPKSFISLDGADHMLSKQADACYVGDVIASWAMRYVTHAPTKKEVTKKQLKNTTADSVSVSISGDTHTKFQCQITAGNHQLIADEPIAMGGTDKGNTPYDYLMSALGACTAMTMKMYAQHKGWAFERFDVAVTHDKLATQAGSDSVNSPTDRLTRHISLQGELTDEQKQRLLAIANKCPIHKTLSHPVEVITQLKIAND